YNLERAPNKRLTLLGAPIDVVVRHYKTDWLGEREPVWLDEAAPLDDGPLLGPSAHLTPAAPQKPAPIANPLGAMVPQNKRAFALLWELLERLPPKAAAAVRRHVPFTARLETLDAASLARED